MRTKFTAHITLSLILFCLSGVYKINAQSFDFEEYREAAEHIIEADLENEEGWERFTYFVDYFPGRLSGTEMPIQLTNLINTSLTAVSLPWLSSPMSRHKWTNGFQDKDMKQDCSVSRKPCQLSAKHKSGSLR